VPTAPLPAGRHAVEGTHEVVDRRGLAAYRQRLAQLDSEIADRDATGDGGAERARTERDWVLAELRRVVGVGGRPRSFVTDAERARVAVTKAIGRALTRIEQVDAGGGRPRAGPGAHRRGLRLRRARQHARLGGGLRPRESEHRNGADSSGSACVFGEVRVAPDLFGVDAVALGAGQFADGRLVCLGCAFDGAATGGSC